MKRFAKALAVIMMVAVATGCEKDNMFYKHAYFDLGLPSGNLWATCNVGADSPEDYGDYFAWGETNRKDSFNWTNYLYCDGSDRTLTKYCNQIESILDPSRAIQFLIGADECHYGGNYFRYCGRTVRPVRSAE